MHCLPDIAETGSDHRSGPKLESCEVALALGDRDWLHAQPVGGNPQAASLKLRETQNSGFRGSYFKVVICIGAAPITDISVTWG